MLDDDSLIHCVLSSPSLSAVSKTVYSSLLHQLRALALGVLPAEDGAQLHAMTSDPAIRAHLATSSALLRLVREVERGKAAIRDTSLSLRSKQAQVKAILAAFKHADCASDPTLLAVRPQWQAFCKELSDEVAEIAKRNEKSAREQAGWATLAEFQAKEAHLAMHDYGSVRHLLLATLCRMPPVRGGDLGRVFVVTLTDPRLADATTNVLVWSGPEAAAELMIKQHKTSHIYGPLRRALPPSVRRVVAASLEQEPRPCLFVSPQSHLPCISEAVFTNWANRELKRTFDGRPVTCNIARHAFISAIDAGSLQVAQLQHIASEVGHSLQQQQLYRRLDGPAAPLVGIDGEYHLPLVRTVDLAASREIEAALA